MTQFVVSVGIIGPSYNTMTTAIMFVVGLLLSLLYLNGVVTAEDCACQEEVNKALIQSLEGCTDTLTAMEECNKEPGTVFNQARKVKMEAQAVGAAISCECAKKVSEALAKSLKGCVEALSETMSCGGPNPSVSPSSTAVSPTTSIIPSPSIVSTSFTPSPSPSPPAKSTSCKEILKKNPARFVFKEFDGAKRCVRQTSKSGGCVSINVPTHNIQYDRVCAEVNAFQIGTPDGISGPSRPGSIDDAYVDGVSLTYGKSPRKHIWTFMGSSSEKKPVCPCATGSTVKVPDFIGNNYFCESGNPEETAVPGKVYYKDLLWNMYDCDGVEASCCRKDKNEYFLAVLPSSTTDDIEVRVCSDEATSDEDFGLSYLTIAIY
uniref:Uncharacterized protein n=1 Tax=Amphimedon queenslandica TaxID=400682 RepID=A0A1X7T6L9_AMPQE